MTADYEKQSLVGAVYTLVVFATMQAVALVTGGTGAQEPFELFAAPDIYGPALLAAGNNLRLVLLLDVFFMIGYGWTLAATAAAHAHRNRVMAWAAGAMVALLVLLDITENVVMAVSLDLVGSGQGIDAPRIALQAFVSGAKWSVSALALVALSMVLPAATLLEKLFVWGMRIVMPLGCGLFVTGAFGAHLPGGALIGLAMGGGLALLAVTTWLRRR